MALVTERDRDVLLWIGRAGAAEAEQVAERFSLGRTAVYRRLRVCLDRGLLTHERMLYGEPGMYVATRAGLDFAGLGYMEPARLSPALWRHWIEQTSVLIHLGLEFGPAAVLTEREIRALERDSHDPVFSCPVGRLPGGRARLHRPDLVVRTASSAVAVEVELTLKAPSRLQQILRNWHRNRSVESVLYYASDSVTPYLTRSIKSLRLEEFVHVRPLPSRQKAGDGR